MRPAPRCSWWSPRAERTGPPRRPAGVRGPRLAARGDETRAPARGPRCLDPRDGRAVPLPRARRADGGAGRSRGGRSRARSGRRRAAPAPALAARVRDAGLHPDPHSGRRRYGGREPAPARSTPSLRRSSSRSAGSSCAGTTGTVSSVRSRSRLQPWSRGPGSRCSGPTTCGWARSSSPPSCSRSACLRSGSRAFPGAGVRCWACTGRWSPPRWRMRASASTNGPRARSSGTRSCGSTTRTRPSSASTRSSGIRRSTAAISSSPSWRRSRSSCSGCASGCSPRESSRSPRCGWACCSRSRSRASRR